MNNFENIVAHVRSAVPKLTLDHSLWYIVKGNPVHRIHISQPDPFDNYPDIVAKITLFREDKVIWTVLIARDTNVKKFCEKLASKIRQGV